MPGLVRRIDDLPPGVACASCLLTQHPDIEWYIDSGILTEVEGPNFICNRCLHAMAMASQIYLTVQEHNEEIANLRRETAGQLLELADLQSAAGVLWREFGLKLEDLHEYVRIKAQLADMTNDATRTRKELKSLVGEREQVKQSTLDLKEAYDHLQAIVNQKNEEYSQLIEASLADVLERRGRTDLLNILFNNKLPPRDDSEPDLDNREIDESPGEDESVFAGF